MKKCDSKKNIKKEYIKPEIEVKELSLHSLLGENGWLSGKSNLLARWIS